jgi:hypothetical protein
VSRRYCQLKKPARRKTAGFSMGDVLILGDAWPAASLSQGRHHRMISRSAPNAILVVPGGAYSAWLE